MCRWRLSPVRRAEWQVRRSESVSRPRHMQAECTADAYRLTLIVDFAMAAMFNLSGRYGKNLPQCTARVGVLRITARVTFPSSAKTRASSRTRTWGIDGEGK